MLPVPTSVAIRSCTFEEYVTGWVVVRANAELPPTTRVRRVEKAKSPRKNLWKNEYVIRKK
jgi:hypothetical protein